MQFPPNFLSNQIRGTVPVPVEGYALLLQSPAGKGVLSQRIHTVIVSCGR